VRNNHEGSRIFKQRGERIIDLVSQGLKNKETAREIGTTGHVVKNHIREIYDKVGMWNRVELALWYVSRHPAKAIEDYQAINSAASIPTSRNTKYRIISSLHDQSTGACEATPPCGP
jgi:DNA-binding CsgD family transcriptional regulator